MSRTIIGLVALLLNALLSTAASAQGVFRDTTEHQRFACLQRERELKPLAAKSTDNNNAGLLRFKLRFVAPDRPPVIELLHDAADADMESLARDYLAGYRLPCLHAADHPVEVVQEFSFRRWGVEPPVPLTSNAKSSLRVAMPEGGIKISPYQEFEYGKALVDVRFVEGREEPELQFVFSSVGRDMRRLIERHVRSYRLLDDGGRPRPITGRQEFRFIDPETRGTKYRLEKDEFELVEFLRLVGNLDEHPIDARLDTMACPFSLRLTLRQPYESNGVHQIDSVDANRAYLMNWLANLRLRFNSVEAQKDLFGSDVRVNVPCGHLDLGGAAPAPLPAPAANAS